VSVVMMNQVTTKIHNGGSMATLVPALGESWSHACTHRVMLSWRGGQRVAHLCKSPSRQDMTGTRREREMRERERREREMRERQYDWNE
jgi:hypothetical protein